MTAIIVSHLLLPSGKYVQHGLLSESVLILPAHVRTGDDSPVLRLPLKPFLDGDSWG